MNAFTFIQRLHCGRENFQKNCKFICQVPIIDEKAQIFEDIGFIAYFFGRGIRLRNMA